MSKHRKGSKGSWSKNFQMLVLEPKYVTAFQSWAATGTFQPSDFLPGSLEAGWKVSFSFSEDYDEYFITLTAKTVSPELDGNTWGLSHKDYDRGLELAYWVIHQGQELGALTTKSRSFMSDI